MPTVDEIFAFTNSVMDRVLLGFVPTDLAFLKAGGRLSNVAFLGAHLLKIKPCIEVTGGKFVATKKFRGSMLKCSPQPLLTTWLMKARLTTRTLAWRIR